MIAAAADSNLDDEHDPEGATIAFERQQLAHLLAQVEARREQVLQAIEHGPVEACETCGRPIGAERLEARPTARTCVICASTAGRARR